MKSTLPSASYGKQAYPFPADPMERLGNILAAYNASAKAITQLLITRQPVTRLELSKRFEEVVAGTALETTDSYNVNKNCMHSLCPLGLVAQEKMPSSGRSPYVITYALTEAGITYGQPAAAAFLTFEKENGFSLFPILGPTLATAPDDPKPPLTRALLLCELAKGSKRASELSASFHRGATVISRSLAYLARSGAITYDTLYTRTGETQVTFSIAEIAVSHTVAPVRGLSTLTPAVAQICTRLQNRHIPITQSSVSAALPEKLKRRGTDRTQRQKVSEVLAGLAEQGYLRRLQFSRGTKSMATITGKGRCVVENLIKPLTEAMRDGTILHNWQQTLVPRVTYHLPAYAEQTAALYYPLSKARDKLDRPDRIALLQKLLQTGKGLTVTQLARTLRVSQMTVSLYLRELGTTHPVTRETRNGVAYYSLPALQKT